MLAWRTYDAATMSEQVFLADVALGTRRTLTGHYSTKPRVAVDPSGRTYWLDEVFAAPAVFVSAS